MRFTGHMLMRSLNVRRSRSVTALLAVTVAATIATALLNLYADAHAKLAQQFRGYGANIVLSGYALDQAELPVKADEIAAPLAYIAAKTSTSKPLVVVGTDISALMKINDFWKVRTTDGEPDSVAGAKAYSTLAGSSVVINGALLDVHPGRVVTTGDADESRLFIPLPKLRSVAPLIRVHTVLLLSPGTPDQLNARISELRQALPGVTVEPVRNLLDTQLSVLSRMRAVMMLASLIIAVIASLSLWSSLTAAVLERRKDYAVLKALGASNVNVTLLFLLEQAAIAMAGALVGYILGCAVAAAIGYYNFHSPVYPRIAVLPWVLGVAALIVMAGSIIPLQRLQKIRPAAILKGE